MRKVPREDGCRTAGEGWCQRVKDMVGVRLAGVIAQQQSVRPCSGCCSLGPPSRGPLSTCPCRSLLVSAPAFCGCPEEPVYA